jgi:hypothetical protein
MATGTDQPCRRHDEIAPVKEVGMLVKPKWLKGRASKIWDEKIDKYSERGLNVLGMEDALAQYCALEADLIDQWTRKLTPPTAQVNAHRIWAAEFHDTPASNLTRGKDSGKGNPFAEHGI